MRKDRTQQSVFNACSAEGSFIPLANVNKEQIRAMLNVSLIDLATAKEWAEKADRESGQWNAIYKLHYDVLHGLCEAFIHFDNIKSKTHECLFSYLCEKNPQLELDWNFFEKIRTKRNGMQYYGSPATYKDWKEISLQINIYIKTLIKAIEEKL